MIQTFLFVRLGKGVVC